MPRKKKQMVWGTTSLLKKRRKLWVWCIDNRVCKISPLAAAPGQASEWHLEIWTGSKLE